LSISRMDLASQTILTHHIGSCPESRLLCQVPAFSRNRPGHRDRNGSTKPYLGTIPCRPDMIGLAPSPGGPTHGPEPIGRVLPTGPRRGTARRCRLPRLRGRPVVRPSTADRGRLAFRSRSAA
jgi:hypothetical protein